MTPKQAQALAAIQAWVTSHGYAPTVRELAAVLGIKPTAAHSRLEQLISKGVVAWPESSLGHRQAHTMKLVEKP